nr:unnamed protein product [Callosobruchus analis]
MSKSGIEEPYSERDHLLQDASDMMKEALTLTPTKKRKLEPVEKQLCEQAHQKREADALHAFMANNSECLAETLKDHNYVPEVSKFVEIELTNLDKDQEEAKVVDGGSTINSSMTNRLLLVAAQKLSNKTNKSKSMRRNALDYLKEKAECDKEIRLKELALEEVRLDNEQRKLAIEEQKIALETQRLNMEIAERNQKMEIERQRFQNDMDEKKNLTELINSQRKLIDRLVTKSGEDKN